MTRKCARPYSHWNYCMVDAYAWQILGQNQTYILYFLPPPLFKKRSSATRDLCSFKQKVFRVSESAFFLFFLASANGRCSSWL